MLTATADIARMIGSTTAHVHSIRDAIRKLIYLERSEIKEMWLDLEMRTADVEEICGESREKLVELYTLRGAWLGLYGWIRRQSYGMGMFDARGMELTAHSA